MVGVGFEFCCHSGATEVGRGAPGGGGRGGGTGGYGGAT